MPACEEKLKEYYNCSLEEIEQKRLRIPNSSASDQLRQSVNGSDGQNQSNLFADNAFGASLDKDFEKLYKSRQPQAAPNTSSIEANPIIQPKDNSVQLVQGGDTNTNTPATHLNENTVCIFKTARTRL